MSKRLHLFQAFGIELEYMIVNRETLDVLPVADELLRIAAGEYTSDYENGQITWSNELVLHVIELKCTDPVRDLVKLEKDFMDNIRQINEILRVHFNGRLMPGAAHPWMDPKQETQIWPHGSSEIYRKYDEIFGCHGHGWSNLQSMHINMPFFDDEEFAPLHTAARILLPLIPALAASSPILDGKYAGAHDKRLVYYQENQQRIPAITGKVIPERVISKRQYQKYIYQKIMEQVKPFDPEGKLDPVWLNLRGIIPRFDRGSIEIRLLDIQECPKADLAIAALIIQSIQLLMDERINDFHEQHAWEKTPLYDILQQTIHTSSDTVITDRKYLELFGIHSEKYLARDIWKRLLELTLEYYPDEMSPWKDVLENMLDMGSLSSRILKIANNMYSRNNLKLIYQELCENLDQNRLLEPWDHSILS